MLRTYMALLKGITSDQSHRPGYCSRSSLLWIGEDQTTHLHAQDLHGSLLSHGRDQQLIHLSKLGLICVLLYSR
jgi:hypothetical protein